MDNTRDMIRKGRNHFSRKNNCPRGHPYDEQNTYRNGRGGRVCRTCKAAHAHARYMINRDEELRRMKARWAIHGEAENARRRIARAFFAEGKPNV